VTQLPPARGIQCEFHLKVRTGTTQAQFHSSYHHYLPNYCVSCSHLLKGQLSRLKLQEIWNISGLNFFLSETVINLFEDVRETHLVKLPCNLGRVKYPAEIGQMHMGMVHKA
jgi:hypothetical protein